MSARLAITLKTIDNLGGSVQKGRNTPYHPLIEMPFDVQLQRQQFGTMNEIITPKYNRRTKRSSSSKSTTQPNYGPTSLKACRKARQSTVIGCIIVNCKRAEGYYFVPVDEIQDAVENGNRMAH